jgi:peptidoglycan hydrolase-like protein with peptidoglycan-binding domain
MAVLAREGHVGEAVKQLQTMLNHLGAVPPLVVDGIFGPKTRTETVRFQRLASLVQDGIVGPITAKALMAASLRKLIGC